MSFEFSKNIFGLDVSEKKLRLIQTKKKGKNLVISSFNEAGLAPGIIINGEIKEPEKMVEAIGKLIKTAKGDKITTKNVAAVLPEPKTFIKVIEVPLAEEKKELNTKIEEEIKNHIPMSLEEIYLDWQILNKTNNNFKVLVGATPKNISESYFSAIEQANLIPLALEIEAIAICRTLIDRKEKQKKEAKIIIDFGAVRTGLIVYDHGSVRFTVSLPISGDKITKTIAETLKLDLEKAEKAKIVCGLDQKKCEGALSKILVNTINTLAVHIKKTITFYKTNFPDSNPVTEIILCGGGSNLDQIDKILSEKLQLPVKIGNPMTNLGLNKKLDIPKDKLSSYTTAIGLALRTGQKEKLI